MTVFLVWWWIAASVAHASDPDLDQAAAACAAAQYAVADAQYQVALKRLGRLDAATYVSWGTCVALDGKNEDAATHFMQAIAVDPSDSVPHYHLSLVLQRLGRWTEAQAEFDRGVAIRSDDTNVINTLLSGFSSANQPAVFEHCARGAVNAHGDVAGYHAALGRALLDLQRYADALPEFQKASDLGLQDPYLPVVWVQAQLGAGDQAGALTRLRAAVAKDPSLRSNLPDDWKAALDAPPPPPPGPDLASILGHTWTGTSVQDADFTQSGKAYLNHELHLSVDGTQVSGTSTDRFTLDGVTYTEVVYVRGTVSFSDNSVTLATAGAQRRDTLPNGLRWCESHGTLTVYQDSTRSDHYVLSGTFLDDCGGSTEATYVD